MKKELLHIFSFPIIITLLMNNVLLICHEKDGSVNIELNSGSCKAENVYSSQKSYIPTNPVCTDQKIISEYLYESKNSGKDVVSNFSILISSSHFIEYNLVDLQPSEKTDIQNTTQKSLSSIVLLI